MDGTHFTNTSEAIYLIKTIIPVNNTNFSIKFAR